MTSVHPLYGRISDRIARYADLLRSLDLYDPAVVNRGFDRSISPFCNHSGNSFADRLPLQRYAR